MRSLWKRQYRMRRGRQRWQDDDNDYVNIEMKMKKRYLGKTGTKRKRGAWSVRFSKAWSFSIIKFSHGGIGMKS